MKENLTWIIVGVIYLAIIYTLVRPNSKGPTVVENISSMLTDLVRGVTGETYNAKTKTWSSS